MNRNPAASSNRKPPVPTDSHAEIEDWIRNVMPALHPIVDGLDKKIRETIPGLQYAVKWKKAYYGLPDLGWIIEMVAYDVSVNVVFHGGAEFDSPPSLGSGRTRYVKVTPSRRRRNLRWADGSSRQDASAAGNKSCIANSAASSNQDRAGFG